ncbi:MAG: NUDIX hydrolase [Candidatus Micrarchaeota archaeon]|nr:NUDIX hydrolase [Candidatus Micrarchaeota archaeon]
MDTSASRDKPVQQPRRIPDDVYAEWVKPNMIVVCSDALIIRGNGNLLLGVREIEPVKGLPWIIGGRVQKGMALDLAVQQQVLKETGLQVAVVGQSGVYRRVYRQGEDRDDLVFTYVVVETGGELKQDFQHSKFVEIGGYGKDFDSLHSRVKQPILESSIFESRGGISVAQLLRKRVEAGAGDLQTYYTTVRDMRRSTPSHDDVTPL